MLNIVKMVWGRLHTIFSFPPKWEKLDPGLTTTHTHAHRLRCPCRHSPHSHSTPGVNRSIYDGVNKTINSKVYWDVLVFLKGGEMNELWSIYISTFYAESQRKTTSASQRVTGEVTPVFKMYFIYVIECQSLTYTLFLKLVYFWR